MHPGGRLTRFSYQAPQELVVENLLDLTHLDFVHGAIFGDPYGAGDEQILVDHTDEVITMTRISEQRLPPKAQAFLTKGKRQDIHQTMQIHVRSGVAVGVAWSTPPGWGICLFLPNVPATPDRTYQEGLLKLIGPEWYGKYVLPWMSRIVTFQDAAIFRKQVPNYRRPTTLVPTRASPPARHATEGLARHRAHASAAAEPPATAAIPATCRLAWHRDTADGPPASTAA